MLEKLAVATDVISLMFIGLVAMLLIGIMLARRIIRSLRYPLAEAADAGVADHDIAHFIAGAR